MKKLVVAIIALPLLLLAAPAQAADPAQCSPDTRPGTVCTMPPERNIVDPYVDSINYLNATVADLEAQLSAEQATIAEKQAVIDHYHSVLEVLGGRIEGYKDQLRWDRHEIKRLRAKVHRLQS